MKTNLLSCVIFGLCLSAALLSGCTNSRPEHRPTNKVKVTVPKGNKTVASVSLPRGSLKIWAGKTTYTDVSYKVTKGNIRYDSASDTYTISGGSIITIVQDKQPSRQLRGDTATIQAENIEMQVYGGYPIDFPNYPLEQLIEALQVDQKITRFRLRWNFSMGGFVSWGTTLYDRGNHTMTEEIIP